MQNQNGPHPNKWDRSGIVLESLGYDQYTIKVDGSGRLTKRNRRFLRRYTLPGNPIEKSQYTIEHTSPHVQQESLMQQPQSQEQQQPYPDTAEELPQPYDIQMPTSQPDTAEESMAPQPSDQLPTSQPAVKRTRGRPPKVKGCPWLRQHHADVQDEIQPASSSPESTSSLPSTAGETSSASPRPARNRLVPKKYDAASGKWI